MSWLQIFTDKPWLPDPAGTVPHTESSVAPTLIALRVLLVAITILFMLFFVTFIERSQFHDFRALAGEPWQPFSDSPRLWLNTAALLLASVAMQGALSASRHGKTAAALWQLAAGGLFAIVFVLLQISVWQFLGRLGYPLTANPANSYFYILTGLHALHLAGGLVALGLVYRRLLAGRDQQVAIRACAVYWHYLFALWLVLFFMLTRTPETYAIIAAFCGLG